MTTPLTENAPKDIVDTVTKPSTTVPLTLLDRCDACQAQAFVRVSILSTDGAPSELLFCGHHFNKHEPALITRETLVSIQDEREKINESASASSGTAADDR